MSRLETKILTTLAGNPDRYLWAKLKSRLAIYYYQKGDYGRANHEVAEVRLWLDVNNDPRSMVYVNLAEATRLFHDGHTLEALQKARRAHAVSSATLQQDLVSLSSAWLAHLEFNEGRYSSSIHFLGESLKCLDISEGFVLARTFSLIADIYNFCGDFPSANPWYRRARDAAVAEGDEIMLGQIIYNSASLRFNSARLAVLMSQESSDELKFIKLMIGSTSNFDVGVSSTAFRSLLPMLNAQLLTIQGDFLLASRIYHHWLESADLSVDRRMILLCRADYALCLARLGKTSEALEQSLHLDQLSIQHLPPDEQSMIFHQLSCMYSTLADLTLSDIYRIRSEAAIQQHITTRTGIFAEVATMLAGHPEQ